MLITALFLVACGRAPDWFGAPPPVSNIGCPTDAPEAALGLEWTVQVHLAQGIRVDSALRHTQWAADWWSPRGVSLTAARPWRRVADAPVLADGPDEAAVFAPLGAAVGALDSEASAIHVVFLTQLAAEDSPAAHWFEHLTGLTVSPSLLAQSPPEDPTRLALAAAGVDGGFRPTIFVGLEALDALPEERARFVLAHELGHAAGLPHTSERGNLMGPGFPRCRPTLDDAQRTALGH